MRREQKIALIIISFGFIASALMCSGRIIFNTTASVPRGFWWVTDEPIRKGDVVRVPISSFSSTEWVPSIYKRKNAWGFDKPFLKRVAGIEGDRIEKAPSSLIFVNGEEMPDSTPLSADKSGRPLQVFPLPITVPPNMLWLLSDSPFGFDSRYLGAASIKNCYKAIPILTF